LQPEQLFQVGFQLSFVLLIAIDLWPGLTAPPWPNPEVVLGQKEVEEFALKPEINLWTRLLAHCYEKLTGRDPLLPSDLRPKWRRGLDGPIAWLLGGLNLSLAALLGSLPITAMYFHLISFSSLIANLVIVPTSGVALASSMGSLILAPLPGLPELANTISWWTMRAMVSFCRYLEQFNWTYEYVRSPSHSLTIVYYIVLLVLVRGMWRNRVIALSVGLIAASSAAIALWNERSSTTITVLPGNGVIYVDAPWKRNDLLVDCGRDYEVATLVKPFLRSRGVDQLNAVALTHGDVAHVEGYSRLVHEFRPKITYTTGARSSSPSYRQILRRLEETPGNWGVVSTGDDICGWRVLHPPAGQDFGRGDDEALVLSKSVGARRITLLSDLGRNGQQALLAAADNVQSEIVVAGVPNDGQVIRAELLEALRPSTLIVTGNDAKTQRALAELRARATNVISTFESGALTVTARRIETPRN
jgi:competence protein ComEC